MNKNLVIIGAGGHGKVCSDIAKLNGYEKILFLDDDPKLSMITGTTSEFVNYLDGYEFFVAIGNNGIRKALSEKIIRANGKLATLIHPGAVVCDSVKIGYGSVVMPGVVLNHGAEIGNGVILNTCSSVDHDGKIKDYVHIGVGTHLAGTVVVGKDSFIGAGVTVINNVSMPERTIIGAGAVVVANIERTGTYVGVPARNIK